MSDFEEEDQTMFELSDEELESLLLETKVMYNGAYKHLKHARKQLFDGFEIDPTEYTPTTAMQRISDAMDAIDDFFFNITVYDKE